MEIPEIQMHPSSLRELTIGDKTFRSSCDFHVTEADLKKSGKELKETEEARNNSLQKLREMLSRDKDIKYRMDDAYLLRYLRYRKFNCKEAYKYLRNFYITRNEYPELFHMPPRMEAMLDTKIVTLLPYTNEDGNIIFIIKGGYWKTEELNIRDLLRFFNLISDIETMNPHVQINGVIDIFDLAGTGFSHGSQVLDPRMLRLWTRFMQELYPWRVSRVVLLNCNALQYAGLTVVRSFLKKKIADRVTPLRSDLSQLHEYVNPAVLPREYGGSLDDNECSSYIYRPLLGNLRYLEYEHSFIGMKKP